MDMHDYFADCLNQIKDNMDLILSKCCGVSYYSGSVQDFRKRGEIIKRNEKNQSIKFI